MEWIHEVWRQVPQKIRRILARLVSGVPLVRRLLYGMRKERDYMRDWVSPEGRVYRMGTFERQRKAGKMPLIANPTFEEIRVALRAHSPKSVLEVGCGWGRLLEELTDEFNIEGCDVSSDMLSLCPSHLRVFRYDIVVENKEFLEENAGRWEVLFTRGVMLYFMEFPDQMRKAIQNLTTLASKRILIWEWPEVCVRMQQTSNNPKFEYHPIEHRAE